jgi:hypothetical protein
LGRGAGERNKKEKGVSVDHANGTTLQKSGSQN